MKLISIYPLILLILSINTEAALSNDLINAYDLSPIKYYSNLEEKDSDIRNKLYHTLNSAHSYSESGNDQLSESCESEDCYKHESLTYRGARRVLFGQIDLQSNNQKEYIVDYYCNKTYENNEIVNSYEVILGYDLIPTSRVINTEHTWPKSMFPVKEEENYDLYQLMLTDLHHLIPTDTVVNRDRENFPFGEVDSEIHPLSCEGPKLGSNSKFQNQIFFEPPNEIKGDIARGLMYFSVKYNTPIDDIQEAFLRKWDKEDPISQKEHFRNGIIHQYQGVRNPFIDFPNLANEILDF